MVTTPNQRVFSFSPLPACRLISCVVFLGLLLAFLSVPMGASPLGEKKSEKKHEPPYALIFGTVWGPDNRPLHGVRVKIRRADQKKAHWELFSNHEGEFAQRVPAGKFDYYVWADLKGYKLLNGKHLQSSEEIKISVENDERVDLGLHLKE